MKKELQINKKDWRIFITFIDHVILKSGGGFRNVADQLWTESFFFDFFSSFSWKLNPSGFFELDEWFEPVRTAVNSGSVYTTRWRRAVDLKKKIFLGMKIKNLKLRIKFWVWMSLIYLVWTFDVDLVKTPKIRSGLRFPLLSRSFLPAWTGRDRLIGKRS